MSLEKEILFLMADMKVHRFRDIHNSIKNDYSQPHLTSTLAQLVYEYKLKKIKRGHYKICVECEAVLEIKDALSIIGPCTARQISRQINKSHRVVKSILDCLAKKEYIHKQQFLYARQHKDFN